MKQFVIIFRQGPRQLTEAELKKRTEETRAWAQHQNAAGHKLDPHILAPEGQRIGPEMEMPKVARGCARKELLMREKAWNRQRLAVAVNGHWLLMMWRSLFRQRSTEPSSRSRWGSTCLHVASDALVH